MHNDAQCIQYDTGGKLVGNMGSRARLSVVVYRRPSHGKWDTRTGVQYSGRCECDQSQAFGRTPVMTRTARVAVTAELSGPTSADAMLVQTLT